MWKQERSLRIWLECSRHWQVGRESVIDSEKHVEINMCSGIVQCLQNICLMPVIFPSCYTIIYTCILPWLIKVSWNNSFWSTNLTLYVKQQVVFNSEVVGLLSARDFKELGSSFMESPRESFEIIESEMGLQKCMLKKKSLM